jgi:hypothetical protein
MSKVIVERSSNDGFIVTQGNYKHVIYNEDFATGLQDMLTILFECLGIMIEQVEEETENKIGFKIENTNK